ncbi:uncharacterized protein [Malus domestica]|uniref:uncharacterized protein n=1 Tax=Malus domestica TaxID=3750 RepID=UPI0010AA917E|nr:uncharacterized protein LOC103410698 [Malus domestica]
MPNLLILVSTHSQFGLPSQHHHLLLQPLLMQRFSAMTFESKFWCILGAFDTQTGRNGTGRNEGVIFEKDMGYICLKMVKHCVPQTCNKPVPGGEVERKNTQNLFRGTARSTHFWRTKRGTERLVPFRPVPSHVPNAPFSHTLTATAAL